jgi:Holliday junction resolvase RusA-like endonuclease
MEKNHCLCCDAYDSDMGCMMSSLDKSYACPLEAKKYDEFFLHMIPPTSTHQMKKVHVVNNKPVFYEPQELKAVRVKLMSSLIGHKPVSPYMTATRLLVKWCFPVSGKHSDGEYKTTKPDTVNLQKMLKDCMTDCGFWKDDALVASEITEKFWANIPGIYIRIEEIGELWLKNTSN